MEMNDSWQGFEVDPVFTKFRKKLEDVVTQKINSGRTINHDSRRWYNGLGCGCPLGCAFSDEEINRHNDLAAPTGPIGAAPFGITDHDAWLFIQGFGTSLFTLSDNNAYYRLGQLYGKRFP